MRTETASAAAIASSLGWSCQVTSWLGSDLLAEEVPVRSGKIEVSAANQVPERLTLTVPGMQWKPDGPRAPLARYGQQLTVTLTVDEPVTHRRYLHRLGRYQIYEWNCDDLDGTVQVDARGILNRVVEARFRAPETPAKSGTLASEFRRLMVPGIPVEISPDLIDRSCPQSMDWGDNRIDALCDIAKAWPARIRTDHNGTIQLLPPLPTRAAAVLSFTDGKGGTVISLPTSDTRAGTSNVLVGRSTATDSAQKEPLVAIAQITSGPMAVTSDGSGYGEVVEYWSSPLASTYAELKASVDAQIAEKSRLAQIVTVKTPPDPRVEIDDWVHATRDGIRYEGPVVGMSTPLTVGDGSMEIDIGVVGSTRVL